MALSGSVETTAWKGENTTHKAILTWTATQDNEGNYSDVDWELKSYASGGYVVVSELRVTIDEDVEFYRDHNKHTNGWNGTVLASGTKRITHNTDGSRKFTIKVEAGIYNWAINCRGEKEFTLTTIPRASDIGATDANIGSKSSIVVTKKASAYTHSIKYEFGSLSGYITESGGVSTSEVKLSAASVSFTIPTSFYAQIPNSKTGKCKLTCTTYSGSTKIGDSKTTEFTVTAPESSCSPVVSGSVADVNFATIALTKTPTMLVRYFSNAECKISAEARNGATIVSKTINDVSVSKDTHTFMGVESGTFKFTAVDSRGYSTTYSVKLTMLSYVKLTVNAQLKRTDPTSGNAVLIVKGNFFNASFGSVMNLLDLKYRVAKKGDPFGEWAYADVKLEGNTYSLSLPLSGLDYRHPYEVQVLCEDTLMSVEITVPVSKGIPVVDWGEGDFRFNVPFLIPDTMYGTTLPTTGKKGQVFFLINSDGTYSIRIHDGTSW